MLFKFEKIFLPLEKRIYWFSKGVMDVHSLPLEIRITCFRLALGTWYKALARPEKEHKDKMKDVYDFIAKGDVQADGAVLPLYWRLPPEEALTLSYPEKNVYWREVWSRSGCAWNGDYASYNYCKFNAIPLCERVRDEEEEVEAISEVRITKRKGDIENTYIENRRVRGWRSQSEGYFWYHKKCRCSTCDRVRYYSDKDAIPYSEYKKVRHIFWGFLERSWKALFSMRDAERLID